MMKNIMKKCLSGLMVVTASLSFAAQEVAQEIDRESFEKQLMVEEREGMVTYDQALDAFGIPEVDLPVRPVIEPEALFRNSVFAIKLHGFKVDEKVAVNQALEVFDFVHAPKLTREQAFEIFHMEAFHSPDNKHKPDTHEFEDALRLLTLRSAITLEKVKRAIDHSKRS